MIDTAFTAFFEVVPFDLVLTLFAGWFLFELIYTLTSKWDVL